MTDEEKKAIEILVKKLSYCELEYQQNGYLSIGKFNAIKEAILLIEKQQKEITQKDNIIDAMAEQLTTPVHNKRWIIDYFEEKTK